MKLTIIIVNYNVKYFLEQAIISVLKASQNISAEIIVVDNNSADASVEFTSKKFPDIKIIANKNNAGFSVANNQGIKVAQCEYILLLNPDTVVQEDTFDKCVAFLDTHPDAGALGVKMIDGKGNFLPESKRGFPSPQVAFYKAFGLSALFPGSKIFGKYHLGYLNENETHEVDVLAGAFMMVRKSVLDRIGLLDETFFMYGEDIDLSYRIVQAGFKNYYFAETQIIHYKGESTKKTSLNYVKMFYNAMKIFARKHFTGAYAEIFIGLLNIAIYFRALLALISRFAKKLILPLADAVLIFIGMFLIKEYWEYYVRYIDGGEYPAQYLFINLPLYILVWLSCIYFSGGYDKNANTIKIIRGIFWGTLVISALYGFLPEQFRFSRGMIIAGAAWTTFILLSARFITHFIRHKNLRFGEEEQRKIIIVGKHDEANRVKKLLQDMQMGDTVLGIIANESNNNSDTLGSIHQLQDIAEIYKANEIIFCSKDISGKEIMQWMVKMGQQLDYKIVADQSISIVGSNSKNTAGDLYTIDIALKIAEPESKRNKRLLDVLFSLFLLITFPFQLIIVKKRLGLFKNIFTILLYKKSWIGYKSTKLENGDLPEIKPGVLSPLDNFPKKDIDIHTIDKLNILYAKNYSVNNDLEIILRSYSKIGN
ncbi:MAG: glycosyltransferase [Fimbriimonadaceae bacterium]|nr:glycosyltransferase [Chitinophagales bacterium]